MQSDFITTSDYTNTTSIVYSMKMRYSRTRRRWRRTNTLLVFLFIYIYTNFANTSFKYIFIRCKVERDGGRAIEPLNDHTKTNLFERVRFFIQFGKELWSPVVLFKSFSKGIKVFKFWNQLNGDWRSELWLNHINSIENSITRFFHFVFLAIRYGIRYHICIIFYLWRLFL